MGIDCTLMTACITANRQTAYNNHSGFGEKFSHTDTNSIPIFRRLASSNNSNRPVLLYNRYITFVKEHNRGIIRNAEACWIRFI